MAIKKYKPTTPGLRGMTVSTFEEITTKTPEKSLSACRMPPTQSTIPSAGKTALSAASKRPALPAGSTLPITSSPPPSARSFPRTLKRAYFTLTTPTTPGRSS